MPPEPTWPDFEVIGKLGQGGTAQVAKVFSKKFHRLAALKFPLQNGQTAIDFNQLAQREFDLIGKLRFPGLVRLLEISTDIKNGYLLMEFCPGPTLEKIGRVDDWTALLNLFSAIVVNLEYLHSAGVIHADLKPDNIFLPSDWSSQVASRFFFAKLSDLALGRRENESGDARVGLGTVGYMAPETVTNGTVSYRSDLFALGVIAYQLVSGRHPFIDDEADPVKINSRVREEEPEPLENFRYDIPPLLATLIRQLTTKDPAKRPESAWEVCHMLRDCGATYNFEKALNPAYLLSSDKKYTENVANVTTLTDYERRRLDNLTDGDNKKLRMVLTANFIRGNIRYHNRHFLFRKGVLLPAYLRRQALSVFNALSFAGKKKAIKTALTGESGTQDHLPHILYELLPHLLRSYTVKWLCKSLAAKAEGRGKKEAAARLYLMAGKLKESAAMALDAADQLRKSHQGAKAILLLQAIIEYSHLTDDAFSIRRLLMLQGDILKDAGEAEKALACYKKIITLQHDHPPDELLAETYKDLGDLYYIKQNSKEGIVALNAALEIYHSLDNQLEVSHTLNNLANIRRMAGEFSQAIKHFRDALRIQKRLGAKKDLASTLNNFGIVYGSLSRLDRATSLFKIALSLQREFGQTVEMARTLNNLGFLYHLIGRNREAAEYLLESLEINRELNRKKEILFNLENLTAVMFIGGQLKQSIAYLKEGMTLAVELNDQPHNAAFNIRIGQVLIRLGRYAEAQNCLKFAESSLLGVEDTFYQITLLLTNALLLTTLGNRVEALNKVREASNSAEQNGSKNGKLEALIFLASIDYAEDAYNEALRLCEELKLRREITLLKFNSFEWLFENGGEITAEFVDELSVPLESMSADIELPRFHLLLAKYFFNTGNISEAEKHIQQGELHAEKNGMSWELAQIKLLRGQIYLTAGEFEKAFQSYQKALTLFKWLSEQIADANHKRTFMSRKPALFLIAEIRKLNEILAKK